MKFIFSESNNLFINILIIRGRYYIGYKYINYNMSYIIAFLFLISFCLYIIYNTDIEKSYLKNKIMNVFELSSLTGISLVLILYGIYKGFSRQILSVELFWFSLEIIWINAVSATLLFMILTALTGLLLFLEVRRNRSVTQIYNGSKITAIIPVYEDGNVLQRSVNSLKESDYNNLEIKIVCEPEDSETIDVANKLSEQNDLVSVVMNEYIGSKSGAIKTVVEKNDADYFAVFDADEIIDTDFISSGMGALCEENYDVFQGRRIPEPNGVVESLAYCERVTYHASYKMVEITGFKNCRSSSTVFKREVYEKVGGYDDLLTEDLAFAHKCYRHNISVRQARNYTSLMEAPHSIVDFWGQRKRWRIGQVEVLHKSIKGNLTDDGIWHRKFISIMRMLTSIIGSIILLVFISKLFVLFLIDATILYILPIIIISLVAVIISYNDDKRKDIDSSLYVMLLSPFVYLLFSLLMIKSILEYLITWDGEWYKVEKNG